MTVLAQRQKLAEVEKIENFEKDVVDVNLSLFSDVELNSIEKIKNKINLYKSDSVEKQRLSHLKEKISIIKKEGVDEALFFKFRLLERIFFLMTSLYAVINIMQLIKDNSQGVALEWTGFHNVSIFCAVIFVMLFFGNNYSANKIKKHKLENLSFTDFDFLYLKFFENDINNKELRKIVNVESIFEENKDTSALAKYFNIVNNIKIYKL